MRCYTTEPTLPSLDVMYSLPSYLLMEPKTAVPNSLH